MKYKLQIPSKTLLPAQRLLIAISLLGALSACSPITTPVVDSTSEDGGDALSSAQVEASGSNAEAKKATGFPDSPSELKNCKRAKSTPQPLSHAENTAAFEQFNFRPEGVTVFKQTVAVATPHYTFHFCKGNKTWIAVSNEAADNEDAYDYKRDLAAIANPPYESIEIEGTTYDYRIRLQADWLTSELSKQAVAESAPEAQIPAALEDAVYFELKKPDGDVISRELYTVSDVQKAQLGASLGVPSMAGVAIAGNNLWFAATTSQGEGDNGFASLLQYDLKTQALSVQQPEQLQGDQITDVVATEQNGTTTLWLGTQRSGEGNPFAPASGLVAYQPKGEKLESFTVINSPLVGAIPHQLAVENEALWVATGNGTCRVQWQAISEANSWNCWRLMATAALPKGGVEVYSSFLATEPEAKLTGKEVEALWISQALEDATTEPAAQPGMARYEVVYKAGFETTLSQGGYRVANAVAQRAAGGNSIFWPGRQWHWAGDRFKRGLDEVSLNLVGGGPYGLVSSSARSGLMFDHKAIRGDFDLLDLTLEGTTVRYYAGWVNSDQLTVYPSLRPVIAPQQPKPNPLTKMASDLPASGP
ncbi:MAG: hypothetical protein WBA76_19335 [Phormidesmis sp.]